MKKFHTRCSGGGGISPGLPERLSSKSYGLAFWAVFAFALLVPGQRADAQTATAACRTITLSGIPKYPADLICIEDNILGGFQTGDCAFYIPASVSYSSIKFRLLKRNANGGFDPVSSWGSTSTFTAPSDGAYSVEVSLPAYHPTYCVIEGNPAAGVFTTLNQWIGWVGIRVLSSTNVVWAANNPPTPSYQLTEVLAGSSTTAIDYISTGAQVTLNATSTDPSLYTDYFVAILEMDPPYRYASPGWTSGAIPNNSYDLTGLWKNVYGQNAAFEAFRSYKIQLATGNGCHPADWNVNEQQFFVCPAGLGCRHDGNTAGNLPISLFPNPADDYFAFPIETIPDFGGFNIVIHDTFGRVVKTVNNLNANRVEVADLENGYYSVSLLTGGKRLFSKKLIVQH